jgi:hypothetical protein
MKLIICFLISLNIYALDCSKSYTPQNRKYTQSKNIELHISRDVHKNSNILFFDGNSPYGKYITLDVSYSPVEELFKQLKFFHPNLKNRGEAHITILTPIEYHCIFLPQGVSINELKSVLDNSVTRNFELLSIGNGYKDLDETFFVIAKSNDLVDVRKKMRSLLKDPSKFDYNNFYPHITLGFSKRDLHESDGVFKNEKFSKDSRFNLIEK